LAGQGIDLKLRLTLREGSVYYFTERHLTSSEPHYFIVVNSDPLAQLVLLLSVVQRLVLSAGFMPPGSTLRRAGPANLSSLEPAYQVTVIAAPGES